MNTLLLILSIVAVLSAGAAIVLRQLRRIGPEGLRADFVSQLLAPANRSVVETYQPMTRLFSEEDFAFLAEAGPGLLQRLRRQRRQVMRLYLGELRADFAQVYAFCRMLAQKSADPNFATLITQQAFSFYSLLLVLHVRCTLGWFLHVRVDMVDVVGAFERLRQAAQAAAAAMAPQQAAFAGSAA
jgi:hypothetical protein